MNEKLLIVLNLKKTHNTIGGLGSPTGRPRTNNRKVVGLMPANVVCITVDR